MFESISKKLSHWSLNFVVASRAWWMGNNWSIMLDRKYAAATVAKSLQSCLTMCDPIDCNPPGSPVPRILQARTLEWVAISFANAWKWKVKVKSLSHVRLLVTPWTAAYQAPLSIRFSRQEYWTGLPCSPPEDLPDSGIEPSSLISPALAGGSFTTRTTWEVHPCLHV